MDSRLNPQREFGRGPYGYYYTVLSDSINATGFLSGRFSCDTGSVWLRNNRYVG
jgi:hypothetical protein